MITLRTRNIVLIAIIAALVTTSSVARAVEPTLSDVATCNEQAAQRTTGSALPAPRGKLRASPPPAQGQSGLAAGEKTDPTGSFITQAPDPLLRGMNAERAEDPEYRAAYRECMRARSAR